MRLATAVFLLFFTGVLPAGYTLKKYDNDPLKVWHYTLDNGLEVYLTENHDKPVFYSEIVVKAGSSSDPAQSTGIAHYLEHMLFKGTDRYGTVDFSKEKPLLDKITALYEYYRKPTDEAKRKEIMAEISKNSAEAAQYAIPNEFDRMYQQLGSSRINAHTSNEETVYKVQCPSNAFKQWCLIESERFRNPVFRLFQTEIEAVYEEKNGALDSKERTLYEAFLKSMYKVHPYGQQSTLGTVEHLKNPSIKDMYEFYNTYYVPNNMAIVISGDINPPEAIKLIDRYFSHWKKQDVPALPTWKEEPLKGMEEVNVDFPGQEQIMIGFRTVPVGHEDEYALRMFDMILDNSQAGLINININQKLLAQKAGCYPMIMNDYGSQVFYGVPKKDQKLDEVKDLILAQIEKVKKGEFEDWLLPAIMSDFTKNQQEKLESNNSKVTILRDLFINRVSIDTYAKELSEMAKLTKDDVVRVANKYFGVNYLVAKRHDKEIEKTKMPKPDFEPVKADANRYSSFANRVKIMPKDVQKPIFVNLEKDITKQSLENGLTLYYVQNPMNEIFDLSIVFPVGEWHDKKLPLAAELFNSGSWPAKPVAELKRELYSNAAQYSLSIGRNESTLSISGLDGNIDKTLELIFELMNKFEATKERISEQAGIILDKKEKMLKDPGSLSYMLAYYARYKEKSHLKSSFIKEDFDKITPTDLRDTLTKLFSYEANVAYTGTESVPEIVNLLQRLKVEGKRAVAPDKIILTFPKPEKNIIYFYNFDSVQTKVRMEFPGELYKVKEEPVYNLFNEYFDGSLGSIVFQEMREKRALAYSAWSRYFPIGKKNEQNLFIAGISTQADKTLDAIKEFQKIIYDVPFDNKRFQVAKSALLSKAKASRVGFRVLGGSIMNWDKLGLTEDPAKMKIQQTQKMTLDSIKEFTKSKIGGQKMVITLVGDKNRLDMKKLAEFGELIEVDSKTISN